MNINELAVWILNSGGAVIIVSWLCERWNWFQLKTASQKQWIFFGFTLILSLSAYAILNFVPANILNVIAPYWGILSGLFVTVFVGEMFHKVTK